MSDPNARLSGLRVLVVEDELVIAMELENLLRRLGCIALDAVPTIQQALGVLASEQLDLVVLDVNLQGQRVTPVAEALQERGVPFVVVIGYGSERLPEKALQDAPCLRKPVNGKQLASVISDILARLGR
ncbi:MAG TPA: response regulator [Vicinamibacterales bacterium]|nr:response regulator [Vicinamibacterales bacterium]